MRPPARPDQSAHKATPPSWPGRSLRRRAEGRLQPGLRMALLMASWWLALAGAPSASHAAPAQLLELATAREMDLDGLAGLGPALTRRVLTERERAPFADWADLQRRVPGIGPAKAAQLSAQGLRIQGQAWPGPRTARGPAAAKPHPPSGAP